MTTITKIGPVELIGRTASNEPVREDIGYQPLLERDVVIRQLSPEAAADPRTRGRFIREARTLAALHHHNIVQVYEAGMQDDVPYVVLEKLEGITVQQRLDRLIDQGARMDVEEAICIVHSVATAVEHVNRSATLVHDVSPANIVLSNDGRTVLASLGQPLPQDPTTASKTALAYAAPERLLGGKVDAHSDVYALGVLLYHLVFGSLPFEGSEAGIISKKQHTTSLPALDDHGTELPCPYALAHLMRQATNRTLEQRYASVTAFRNALSNVLSGGPVKVQLHRRPSYATYQRLQLRRRLRRASPAEYDAVLAAYESVIYEAAGEVELAREVGGGIVVEEAPARPAARQPATAPQPAILKPVEHEEPAPFDVDATDPLLPGRDTPALHAALPFTLLVPLPEGAQAEEEADAPEPGRWSPRNLLLLLSLLSIAAVSIGMAVTLG